MFCQERLLRSWHFKWVIPTEQVDKQEHLDLRERQKEDGENRIMRSFVMCVVQQL
jgi:hypothetical protein